MRTNEEKRSQKGTSYSYCPLRSSSCMLFLTANVDSGEPIAQLSVRQEPSSNGVARLVTRFERVGGLLLQLTAFFGGRGVILVYAQGCRAAR